MKVLLIGGGGREHALADKLSQSPRLSKLFAAPGNPGIAKHAELVELDPEDHAAVIEFCARERIDLVVIGPEAPLVAGIGDDLREAGIAVFGPGKRAAQLEGSKSFTKELCVRHGIPTARYVQTRDPAALDGFGLPVVIKADGLAAGKGVVIAETRPEAEAAIAAGDGPVVVEEFLEGEEVSFFALTDGEAIVPFGSAQDHKRVGDGDTGPNTGGMGAYSPASVLTPDLERRVLDEIVRPTVRALADASTPYSGVLFAGLMLTAEGPKLIEYNARFGDPECQVLMARLESDLLELLLATAQGRLRDAEPPRFADEAALTVVMAARGYPGAADKGGAIGGLGAAESAGAKVFQAGTALRDDRLIASGGRVLAVTARGTKVSNARDAAYAVVDAIEFPSGFFRRDIGWREIERERAAGQTSAL